ncbi:polyubiquitin-tagged protein recognition complex, Npl4 component [Coprinopsis marcescibilis]|uniref:Nuclear protein localization protein 4 n=1 Tax=Coprinopsis marcescibilis TaxID=230819 RepID=A0A5C3LNU7_COPMA|nr:polyubiquitin-tagged protein recognition complex, Npl4 component [Coprinopsis marcescibilis]
MLIRIRSRDGNFRHNFEPTSPVSDLLAKILESSPEADPTTVTISNQPRGNEALVSSLRGRTIQNLGLSHGDLVFVNYKPKSNDSVPAEQETLTAVPASASSALPANRPWELVKEDTVDEYWRSQTGKIPRGRDSRFCKHGANGMCDYCMPLEPYDAAYHKEHSIKHLSYHAYLQRLTPKQTLSSTSILPPLNPISYKVKVPCPTGNHPPWPAGICTGCQPSTITLQSQQFRMVDHLEIASMDIVDRFLQAWRKTGMQRFGWLVGRYEPYDKVPMGVKAVVEAIYEPLQQGEIDGLSLAWPWEEETRIRDLASNASPPLSIVGYIFTDLDPTPEDRTKNVYKRHPQSFFLSSLEAIFAATVQAQNPTNSKSSPSGKYASRMVTAVLTATEDGQVDVSAYQVSEQAVAMVEADMIEASVDPGVVRVKEEDRTQDSARYVPDVFFSYKNEYGLEVKKSAKPCFPVEYLIVNVTHGFPQAPSPVFRSTQFCIENRSGLEDQTVDRVMSDLSKLDAPSVFPGDDNFKKRELAKYLSDFHLVAFLQTTQLFSVDDLKLLIRTVTSPNLSEDSSVLDPVLSSDGWQTLMTFTRESAPARPESSAPSSSAMDVDAIPPEFYHEIAADEASRAAGGEAGGGIKICPHCTFENSHGGSDCDVCGLPL